MSGAGEPGDGGAGDRRLDDVVMAARSRRAIPLAHPQLPAGDHYAVGADPPDVSFQRSSGIVPRLTDQFGPAGHLLVARELPGLPGRARSSCRNPIEMPSA